MSIINMPETLIKTLHLDTYQNDTVTNAYRPYMYENEQQALTNLLTIITTYTSGVSSGAGNVSITTFDPAYRCFNGDAVFSSISFSGVLNPNPTGTRYLMTSSHTPNQIGYYSDGTNHGLFKLIDQQIVSTSYYYRIQLIGRNTYVPPTLPVTLVFSLAASSPIVDSLLVQKMNLLKSVLEKELTDISLNTNPTANDIAAQIKTSEFLFLINRWLINPFYNSSSTLSELITAINTRLLDLITRKIQIISSLSTTNAYSGRLRMIFSRIHKTNGNLSGIGNGVRTTTSMDSGKSNSDNQLSYYKDKMIVKSLKKDGTGGLFFICEITPDEDTYHFSVGNIVYIINDDSTSLGTAMRIIGINYTVVDDYDNSGNAIKTKAKIYRVNRVVSKKYTSITNARVIRFL